MGQVVFIGTNCPPLNLKTFGINSLGGKERVRKKGGKKTSNRKKRFQGEKGKYVQRTKNGKKGSG